MSTAIIPELSYLLQVVEKTYGRKLYTTTDFESLSIIIENKIGELISSSTLKRLYGYVSMKPVPRKSTLDVLSRFIGYRSFEDFRSELKTNPKFSSNFFSTKTVCAASLQRGDKVKIGWMPDRVVTLSYLGDDNEARAVRTVPAITLVAALTAPVALTTIREAAPPLRFLLLTGVPSPSATPFS